ncbi:MAG: hypothetical protein SPK50_08395 [Mobiluncus porci]|uniref:hypothetical protein n=1 Tax=Mobiluncus TaxID=2050 RepID=UPI0023F22C9B|nr:MULTISPECIES: hypothetical protein [Mobiluncus]MCI6583607.1 hypothetical protein [Mobiluncus sp.]MDD7542333.1 hypothetical protein [Mobiluncus porci]MDY5749132.1 hypothetical protein [Mobiluncus porci]
MSFFETQGFVPGVDPELLAAQIQNEMAETLGEPLGEERLRHLLDLARLASKHGLEDMEISVRLEIVWDSLESGDTEYALATFSWILDEIAHGEVNPNEEQALTLATQMLQIPVLAARHPKVPAEIINNLLFWTEHYAVDAGIGLHSRQMTRHQVELGLGHRLAARESLDIVAELEEIPRVVNDEIDCPLHHFRSRIAWAVNSSEYAHALALYRDALERTAEAGWQCLRPDDINTLLMLPLAWAAEGDAAWRAHERSYRQQSETSQYLGDIAAHLRYCAATWNLSEGLEMLGTHAHWFSNPEDPWDLLVSTRAGATFLKRAVGAYIGTGAPIPALGFTISGENQWLPFETIQPSDTLATAQVRLERVARRLSLAFDARNANNTVSTRTAESLREPPMCDFSKVKPLIEAHLAVEELLTELGLDQTSTTWLLPPLDDPAWTQKPVPEFHLLDFTKGQAALQRFGKATASFDFDSLPPEISGKKERLLFGANQVAILGMTGKWDDLIDSALPLLEVGEQLDEHRQSLRLASYLVQAYWQVGELTQARNWLIRADAFVDGTIPASSRALLENLALIAG